MRGKLIDFNTDHKCGFVVSEGKRYFIMTSSFPTNQRSYLKSGERITFDVGKNGKAVNARLIDIDPNKATRLSAINEM